MDRYFQFSVISMLVSLILEPDHKRNIFERKPEKKNNMYATSEIYVRWIICFEYLVILIHAKQ